MQHLTQTNEHDVPVNAKNVTAIMQTVVETLEKNPLSVRSCLPALTNLSKWSNIEDLDTLLSDLQRSLREQALYQSSGYDENVKTYAKRLAKLFNAVLADSSGETN